MVLNFSKWVKMVYLTWKQRKWEWAIESVTMAQFYHLRDEDIAGLDKILDEARERLKKKKSQNEDV